MTRVLALAELLPTGRVEFYCCLPACCFTNLVYGKGGFTFFTLTQKSNINGKLEKSKFKTM